MTRPVVDHARFKRIDDAVATSREGHRSPSASTCAFSDPFVLSFKLE
jgi:hypothetical protein